MKTALSLSILLSGTLIASANTIELWDFGTNGNFSSITTYNYDNDAATPETPRHIGGSTVDSSSYEGWDFRAADGATVSGTRAVAAGSTRFAMNTLERASTNNSGATNAFYGAQNFKGVPWANGGSAPLPTNHVASGEYYVAAAAQNEAITLTMKITDVDFSQTTGNSNNNANFGVRLWDRASGFGQGNGKYFMGITVLDTYANDRLQLALQSSNGTILSGGTGLTGTGNRTRIGWLTTANVLESAADYELTLTLDLAGGIWSAQINDEDAVTGTFNTNHIVGIEAYQAAFQQFSPEDYIDVDEISVSVQSLAGILDPVEVYYQVTSAGTNIFSTLDGYTPNTNGNLIFKTAPNLGVSELNWTNFIREAGGPSQWAESTTEVAGTNATEITSAWIVKDQGGNAGMLNNGMQLNDEDPIWAAPGAGDYITFENNATKFIIDSDVSLAALTGNARTDAGHGDGGVITVKEGGSLTIEGTNSYSNMSWVDSMVQLGAWGNSDHDEYKMTLEVDGGSLVATNVLTDRSPNKGATINIAHSKATGELNISTNGGSIAAHTIQVGFDAAYRSTGTVNIAAGTLSATSLYVGNASRGEVNVSGGELNMNTNGQLRIGYRRTGVNSPQQGGPQMNAADPWPTIDMNGEGLVDISGGTLNATASNVQVTVGYDNAPSIGQHYLEQYRTPSNAVAELKIRDGGTANFTAGNKLMVGRWSDGIVTVEDGGTLNLADETVAIGYGPGTGTLNVTGGTINQTGNRFSIGAYGQGVGIVNMSGGTINANAIIMGDSANGTTNSGVSTFNQTGGTVYTLGGEARFGVRGDAVYNIGGGENTALLSVNPTASVTNAAGNALARINLSYADNDSTLNILSNGVVQTQTITMDNVNEDNDGTNDVAILNLNEGGTLIIEGNWPGALGVTNGAQINISGGQFLWHRGINAAVSNMQAIASYINLTGGGSEEPPANSTEVFSDGDYTLYGIGYNSSNTTYSTEAYTNGFYTRFISVDRSSIQTPYQVWVSANGVTGSATDDDDQDGVLNYMEFALGGNPADPADVGVQSSVTTMQKDDEAFNRIMLVHPRAKGTHGLNYRTEHATDILFGSWSAEGVIEEGVDTSGAIDMVTNSVPATNNAGFLRLQVELPE